MSTIHIRAAHQLEHADALQAADELAGDLAGKFGIDYGWDEDIIHFDRPGVFGTIEVGKREILIRAKLDFLLIMLKGRIEEEIRQYLRNHFGCKFMN